MSEVKRGDLIKELFDIKRILDNSSKDYIIRCKDGIWSERRGKNKSEISTNLDKHTLDLGLELYSKGYDMNRQSGRSYRIANNIIDALWNEPIGSKISVRDHYIGRSATSGYNADNVLLHTIEKRLANDFPNLKYRVIKDNNNIYIVRESKTYLEHYRDEFNSNIERILTELNTK